MTAAGWEGLLDAGEQVLWQGQPRPGLAIRPASTERLVMGLALVGFALVWFRVTSHDVGGLPGVGWLVPLAALPFLGIGLYNLGGDALWRTVNAGRTWYTLTDRRALIATDIFGRRELRSWPIDPATIIDYAGEEPGTIRFAGSRAGASGGAAFERIAGAAEVHALMRRVQRGQA